MSSNYSEIGKKKFSNPNCRPNHGNDDENKDNPHSGFRQSAEFLDHAINPIGANVDDANGNADCD